MDEEHAPTDDSLPPPFRPWGASGIGQPGADRPRSATEAAAPWADLLPHREASGGSRVRRYPPSAYAAPPRAPGPGPAPSPASSVPAARAGVVVGTPLPSAGARLRRDRYVVGLALLAAVTAWLPWFRGPGTSMFELTGGTGVLPVLNAWDLPARYLWSGRGSPGGIELGWFVVGFAVLMVVACGRGWSLGAVRSLAGLQAATALLFMAQTFRHVHDASGPLASRFGTFDYLGFGPFVLLLLSIGVVLVPRR